jgi:putative flippase GtrA
LGAFSADYFVLVISYYILNLPLWLSTSLGYFTGFAISFTINRRWVFGGKQREIRRQVPEYFTLVVFNYIFTVVSLGFLNNRGITPGISKLLVMILIMCWNYVLFRWVIFTNKPD